MQKSDRMQIAAKLYSQGHSLRSAAETAGVSASGLWKYLVRSGIARRPAGPKPRVSNWARAQILREHLEYGIGISALARKYNLSRETVRKIFKEEGKLTYTLSQIKRVQAAKRDKELQNRILSLYRKGFPVKEIAKTVRTSQRRVSRIVRNFIQSLPDNVLSLRSNEGDLDGGHKAT